MNYDKYSKQSFETHGLNTESARQLADELQDDVASELHQAVLPVFLRIVEELNRRGHKLSVFDPIQVGDIAFRDVSGGPDACQLRLGCDVVISAGYADTWVEEDSEGQLPTEPA